MLNMSVGFGNANASGTFILDTGAAISFISTDMANAIGLDSNHDGVARRTGRADTTVRCRSVASAAPFDAPDLLIDRFTVPTDQGVSLDLEGSRLPSSSSTSTRDRRRAWGLRSA